VPQQLLAGALNLQQRSAHRIRILAAFRWKCLSMTIFPFLRKHLTDTEQEELLKMLPDVSQANLLRLREDYPELYKEFREAPSPFALTQ
jgi:hypothetical protein